MFVLSMSLISKAFAPDSTFDRDRHLTILANALWWIAMAP